MRTTNEAYELWKRIAAGEGGPDAEVFVREVARAMVEDIFPLGTFSTPNERAPAALKAVGYVGRLNPHAQVDALIDENPDLTPQALADGADLVTDTTLRPDQIARRARTRRKQ